MSIRHKQLMFRFRDRGDLLVRLTKEAKKNNRSLNSEMLSRLAESFDKPDMAEVVRKAIAANINTASSGQWAGMQQAVNPYTGQLSGINHINNGYYSEDS